MPITVYGPADNVPNDSGAVEPSAQSIQDFDYYTTELLFNHVIP